MSQLTQKNINPSEVRSPSNNEVVLYFYNNQVWMRTYNATIDELVGPSVQASSIDSGTIHGQTLYWDGTTLSWQATDTILINENQVDIMSLTIEQVSNNISMYNSTSISIGLSNSSPYLLIDQVNTVLYRNDGLPNIIQSDSGADTYIVSNVTRLLSGLSVQISVATLATHDVNINEYYILIDSTVTNTINMPASPNPGDMYILKKYDSVGNVITVVPNIGTIEGSGTYNWVGTGSSIEVTYGLEWHVRYTTN